jgi:Ca-activated chloride channel family protein
VKKPCLISALLASLALLTACSDMNIGGAGDLGTTQGGAQDINHARELIAAGYIPPADAFTAEGLFSEHDLPLSGEECGELLCPRAAASVHEPADGSEPGMLVQLGFGTDLDAETFERPPLNLAVAVDVSGSMAGEKIEATRTALHALVDQLDGGDRLSLVSFNERARVLAEGEVMDAGGRERLHSAVEQLDAGGSTDIEEGLDTAYDQVADRAGQPGVEDRVMIFTDAQPNVGATDSDSFLGMARYHASAGVGLSVFGVGLDLGDELATAISETRGGNYFYLATIDDIAQVFDEDFDYMVTPVAYDLEVEVVAVEGLAFEQAWGAPLDHPGDTALSFGTATLFLSSRQGGMGVWMSSEVVPAELSDLASFKVRYEPASGGAPVVQDLAVAWAGGAVIGGSQTLADDVGVYKMTGLVDEILALEGAAAFCTGDLASGHASGRISEAIARLGELAGALEDSALAEEVALMRQLQENLEGGVTSCY